MTPLFRKLNLKGQTEIVVLNAPESFEPELAALEKVAVLRDINTASEITFALVFVTTLEAIEATVNAITPKAKGDLTLWYAYPKSTSKKIKCAFNRDTGWEAVGRAGFEPVRQVAIDEDWSALRFRQVAFIKTLTRPANAALSETGKVKAAQERVKDDMRS